MKNCNISILYYGLIKKGYKPCGRLQETNYPNHYTTLLSTQSVINTLIPVEKIGGLLG